MMVQNEHVQARRKRMGALVVLALLLIGLAAVLSYLASTYVKEEGLKPDPNVQVGSVANAMDYDGIVDEGLLLFSINATPVFASGTEPGNLLIENLKDNKTRFTVAIYRNDTGQKIYESGYLDPGQYIENAPLDVALPAGEYACTARFSTYRLSDETPIGQADVGVTVHVAG